MLHRGVLSNLGMDDSPFSRWQGSGHKVERQLLDASIENNVQPPPPPYGFYNMIIFVYHKVYNIQRSSDIQVFLVMFEDIDQSQAWHSSANSNITGSRTGASGTRDKKTTTIVCACPHMTNWWNPPPPPCLIESWITKAGVKNIALLVAMYPLYQALNQCYRGSNLNWKWMKKPIHLGMSEKMLLWQVSILKR